MIELRSVRYAYAGGSAGRFALKIDELNIDRGEVVACAGPSGAGKTTLLHLVAGVLRADSGCVRVLGEDLSKLSDARRRALRLGRIGMVFQEFELLEYVTAGENILISARLGGGPLSAGGGTGVRARAEALAATARIAHLLDRKPRMLSQGERQRVAICRALAPGPELILCDEPTGNLDPETSVRIVDLLLEEASRSGATVLMVTHNHDVLGRCDRVIDFGSDSLAGVRS